MIGRNKFDILKLKGDLDKIRDWMKCHHVPPYMLFIFLGIISTIWFLIRVIPKPSRATYPCMRVAAPFMSGFFVYLITLGGITVALRKVKKNLYRARYIAAASFLFVAVIGMVFSLTHGIQDSFAGTQTKFGPDDGPNQPIGNAVGINPGRVIWAWDPKATNENCTNKFDTKDWYFTPENTNREVVNKMFSESIKKLVGKTNLAESWDQLFRYHNIKKSQKNIGYTKGEKIFIKINQTTSRGLLSQNDKNNGNFIPLTLKPEEERKKKNYGAVETNPNVVLMLLRQLVNELGIDQSDIAVGDPQNPTYGHNYLAWSNEFPNVVYIDRSSANFGRTLIHPTSNDLIFYSDKTQSDKLYDIIENADYMINVSNLKPHAIAGITLSAKNHFGSQSRDGASHLHYSLIAAFRKGVPSNTGYNKYRVLVDMMGSKYLGKNTMLIIVDGLYGGGGSELLGPVKYFMPPFNNDWCNSIFMSQDQVAIESVCYDFLRTEWDGTYNHDPSNNEYNQMPNVNGVDDYLHQAADKANWPKDIIYDPDNSGKPFSSLGIHEHWNDPVKKQYSRNLGHSNGIELISIPDTLVGSDRSSESSSTIKQNEIQNDSQNAVNNITVPETKALPVSQAIPVISDNKGVKNISVVNRSFDGVFQAKIFSSGTVDDDNAKWFLTEAGIVSFDGKKWVLHNKNRKVPVEKMKGLAYDFSSYGPELWIASPLGATVASLPVDARTGATTYYTGNTKIVSDNILSIAVGKGSLRWFGSDKGISAFRNKKWLTYAYQRKYPESMFKDFPITAMATSPDGDSLYVATEGAGVTRVFRDETDAISGASEYAQWGPIEIPSDKVYSICITPDGTQWFGTDMGAAKHTGYNTLENWTVFTTEKGLINNFVQAIAVDKKGKVWFGTKGGVSVFDGSVWTSYTTTDGLNSNNILFILADKADAIWIGTDNGLMIYNNGEFVSFK